MIALKQHGSIKSKAQLTTELELHGISFSKTATKAVLVALLEETFKTLLFTNGVLDDAEESQFFDKPGELHSNESNDY